jgi:hypothetical protein
LKGKPYLQRIALDFDSIPATEQYPFTIPAIRELFVRENDRALSAAGSHPPPSPADAGEGAFGASPARAELGWTAQPPGNHSSSVTSNVMQIGFAPATNGPP